MGLTLLVYRDHHLREQIVTLHSVISGLTVCATSQSAVLLGNATHARGRNARQRWVNRLAQLKLRSQVVTREGSLLEKK
jgi:hypothetical protein